MRNFRWINEQTSSEQQKLCFTYQNKMQSGDANRYEFNILHFPVYYNQDKKDNITPIPQSHWEA